MRFLLSSLGNSTYLGLSLVVDFTKIDLMILTHVITTYCLNCVRWVPTKSVHVTQVFYRTCAASACVITCSEWSLIFSMMMTTPITNQYLKHESPGPVTCATVPVTVSVPVPVTVRVCDCDCACGRRRSDLSRGRGCCETSHSTRRCTACASSRYTPGSSSASTSSIATCNDVHTLLNGSSCRYRRHNFRNSSVWLFCEQFSISEVFWHWHRLPASVSIAMLVSHFGLSTSSICHELHMEHDDKDVWKSWHLSAALPDLSTSNDASFTLVRHHFLPTYHSGVIFLQQS